MTGKTHKAIGVATGVALVIYSIRTSNMMYALGLATAPFGAMLPDIDHDRSKLGAVRKRVTEVIHVAAIIVLVLSVLFGVQGHIYVIKDGRLALYLGNDPLGYYVFYCPVTATITNCLDGKYRTHQQTLVQYELQAEFVIGYFKKVMHSVIDKTAIVEKARTFTGNEIVDVPLSSISNVISSYNSVTNTNNAKAIINSIVSDAFTKSVFLNTSTLLKVYNIPSGISRLVNTNPIEGITVLAQVSGVRISTNKENQAFSVGGSKLTTANFMAAYTRSGIKYYVEVSKLTSAAKRAYPIDGSVKVYLTAQEAAKAGYSYDIYIRQFSN